MTGMIRWRVFGFVIVLSLIGCLPAFTQVPTGAIEGVVKDESGGVLPGVTVEVRSPALIEGTRTMVTEASGNYRFLRLPVGTYVIKFSLEGFTSIERTGIVINAGFTATINITLKVGSLTETVTVVGGAPVVDVRGSTARAVLTADVIETIPSARNVFDMSKFVIGASTSTPDVGGSTQHLYTGIQIHGSRGSDRGYYRDGVRVAAYFGDGDAPRMHGMTGAQQEVNYESAAIPASVAHGGMVINMVSKDGGNRLSGTVFASGSFPGMQSSNLDDELRSRGVELTSGTKQVYDVDMTAGFPLKRDKVWLFGDARIYGITTLQANQRGLDGNQAEDYNRRFDYFLKATTQLNNANKLAVSMGYDGNFRPQRREGATFVTDEAAGYNTGGRHPYNRAIVASWTSTRGNNWIFEAGFGYMRVGATTTWQPNSGPVARLDLVTSTLTGAANRVRGDKTFRQDYNVSATHVFNAGGSHQLRFGSNGDWGTFPETRDNKRDMSQNYRNGVPDSVDLYNTPVRANTAIREFGFYVQDSWMIANRLTINAGVRYDYLGVSIPEQYSPAGTWVPERRFDKIPVVTWQDVVPRLGASYDLLGTGRTVLKGSFSQYMGVEAAGIAQQANPNYYSSNRCTWRDLNGDDLATADEISQCQGWTGGVTGTRDPDLRRPYNNEYSLGVQHQLARNLGMSVMYFRRENRDLRNFVNMAVPTAGYIPVPITN
ncbi:MAG: TonB-dependent receptor, partial [Acidobacteria bacterium]|nr:TonB-dependent receptor [Acidobacteriota bacterium]